MDSSPIKELLICSEYGKSCSINGWIKTRRDSKAGFSFLEINDGSCLANIQVIAEKQLPNYEGEIVKLHPGASVRVTGILAESPGGKQKVEIVAKKVTIYGFCDITKYPLQKQRISFEKLREVAHLRARTNTFGAITRVRNAMSFATHCFFQEREFYYLNTPIITTGDCEGAGELFKVSTLGTHNLQLENKGENLQEKDFFGEQAYLTVSGQLEAETYACGLGKVYTFGPTFRAENSNTSRHLAEFWMVEPEMAFADLIDDAELAENYLKFILSYVLKNCEEDMEFFNTRIDNTLLGRLNRIINDQFVVLPYSEVIDILSKSNKKFDYPIQKGMDLQSEHERYLVEKKLGKPVVVINFPKKIKPFYMRVNDDGDTVAAMDVLLPGIGEIIGGSQREERLDVIISRMEELKLDPKDYWWYLDLRRFGTVPHAGFGVGFERLVQFVTGMKNIRDTIPYPRTPKNAQF